MLRALLVVGLVVVVVLGLAWAYQRRLIYYPAGRPPPAASVLEGAREVVLSTGDGLRLGAWYVPGRGGASETAVLVANGNAGERSLRAPLADALARRGLAVLLFDYRGYGGNPGTPSEQGLALDVRAAHRYLVEEAGFGPDRLVYYGESLGAAVVTELAAHSPPRGLVLRSPFTDLAAVGRYHYPYLPVRMLLRDRYPLTTHLANVRSPVTVVYGTADSVVPAAQSRAVAESVPGATAVAIPGADHNDLALLDGPEVVEAVVKFAGS
ncbi:alpha/beta fold hydrolase [Saccharopolyspora erythraea]|uniref:alpha/beta hydrolase n=1 Tax=Saccharopolyspora erythraea TaxID=1836 RepID=UPI001BA631B8|nr:alpha/beta fold hydrolase [Saccharopolyspora erythraea]QUH03503.1 alpha/beta fold hydrolase [Saccharopolyspora erythraea]